MGDGTDSTELTRSGGTRMDLVDQVTQQFRASQYFGVPASPDADFVAVYYVDGDLLIAGKGREMPRFLLFHRLPHQDQIWISDTGKGNEWEEITANSGGLAALALLDPRRVIEAKTTKDVGSNRVEVDLSQLLKQTGVTDAAANAHSEKQLVKFTLDNGSVTQMVQNDIAEPKEPVAIRFVTEAPASLPPYELPPLP